MCNLTCFVFCPVLLLVVRFDHGWQWVFTSMLEFWISNLLILYKNVYFCTADDIVVVFTIMSVHDVILPVRFVLMRVVTLLLHFDCYFLARFCCIGICVFGIVCILFHGSALLVIQDFLLIQLNLSVGFYGLSYSVVMLPCC